MAQINPNPRAFRLPTGMLDLGAITAILMKTPNADWRKFSVIDILITSAGVNRNLSVTPEVFESLLNAYEIYLSGA